MAAMPSGRNALQIARWDFNLHGRNASTPQCRLHHLKHGACMVQRWCRVIGNADNWQ
jgi:hypothetical protein